MKKTVKKLTLCKETLLRLEAKHLKAAAGDSVTCFTWYCQTGTRCNISLCICD